MSLFESASLVVTPNGYKEQQTLFAIKPTDGSGDLSVVRATTATRVDANGLIESVSANVPRLDYSNGSCPSILVEPQRTNLALYSEDLTQWSNTGSVTNSNVIDSVIDNVLSDEIVGNGSVNIVRLFRSINLNSGNNTFSCFLKANTENFAFLEFGSFTGATGVKSAFFDLVNGTTPTSGAKIENYGNGWYRCSITANINSADLSGTINIRATPNNTSSSYSTSANANNKSIYIIGVQVELGSYATSYIPTTTASVTRNADVISKTGISSLIGQTEGTMFVDVNIDNFNSSRILEINDGSSNNRILLQIISNNRLNMVISESGSLQSAISTTTLPNGKYKIAVSYLQNNISFFVNGILIGTDVIALIPNCNRMNFGSDSLGGNALSNRINSAIVFKTKLTDQECIALTTL
jgi:hypothetical protein